MLHGARKEALRVIGVQLSLAVVAFDDDMVGAFYITALIREGKATFIAALIAVLQGDARVDQLDFSFARVNYDHSAKNTDLPPEELKRLLDPADLARGGIKGGTSGGG